MILKRPKELWSNPDKYKLKTDFKTLFCPTMSAGIQCEKWQQLML